MGTKRHKPEKIVTKLRQVEVLCERFHVRTRATEYSNSRLSIAPSVVFLCNWDIARKKGEGIPKRFFRRSDNGHVYPELISTEKTVV